MIKKSLQIYFLQNIQQNKLRDFDKLFDEKINSILLIKESILSKSDAVIEIFSKLSFPYNLCLRFFY